MKFNRDVNRRYELKRTDRIRPTCLQLALALVFAALLAPIQPIARAAEVTVTWNPNTESDLAGYKLYYGCISRQYDHVDDVGNTTTRSLSSLVEGTTYYITVTAYDQQGNESGYSNEIVFTAFPPYNNVPLEPSAPSGPFAGYTQQRYGFATAALEPDGDALEYRFDWGDGTVSSWGGSFQQHAWLSEDIYCIKAQAIDPHGAASDWSDCSEIEIISPPPGALTITADATIGGVVIPAGKVTLPYGGDYTFTISPDADYLVSDIRVDGVSEGAMDSYTFFNVTEDHTIEVVFTFNRKFSKNPKNNRDNKDNK